jgi:hypothetical protein
MVEIIFCTSANISNQLVRLLSECMLSSQIGKDPCTNRTLAVNAQRAGFDAGVDALKATKTQNISGIEVTMTTKDGE